VCFSKEKRGARRDRTADLYNAIVALYHLSYDPYLLLFTGFPFFFQDACVRFLGIIFSETLRIIALFYEKIDLSLSFCNPKD
jgi:hypothetical protein